MWWWGSLICGAAALNTTAHRRLQTKRPTRTALLGPPPRAIVLFTHLRRCGGSFVEDALLKPHAKSLGSAPLLCKEGALARLQRLAHPLRRLYKRQLAEAPLVWRHCPFGAHELLGEDRPYVYITMLRQPLARMASWFAYCDKYSRDKCHTAPYQVHGGSKILNFYKARQRKYAGFAPSKLDLARQAPVLNAQTFHPNWLEYTLDDNYAVRMVAGGEYHDAPVPVDGSALTTARNNLRTQYAFVGTLERQKESLCVLSALLGVATPKAPGDKLRGPTTHTRAAGVPDDFRQAFASYTAQDDQLYAEALELLDAHVEAFPRCKS